MTAWLIQTIAATSLLALAILALRRPVAGHCGASWAYALWLLIPLRLVTPPLGLLSPDLAETLPLLVVTLGGAGQAVSPSSAGPAWWTEAVFSLWAGGALLFLLWQGVRHQVFLRRIDAEIRPSYPAEHAGLRVIESRSADGPLAVGLAMPRIVVPFDFLSRYSPAEQQLALQHEWVHHRRGDLWWNLLALGLLAAHWFNPIAWIAFRAYRADQELACDAAVLRTAPDHLRQDYGRVLVKAASGSRLIAACRLNSPDQLKRRLKMMKTHRTSRIRNAVGGLVLAGALVGGLGLSAPVLAQDGEPRTERRIIVREIGKDGKRELPADIKELTANCPEAQRLESDVRTGAGSGQEHRTRVIVCSKGGQGPAGAPREKLLAALDRARAEIERDSELSPERRAEASAALRREIERVRSGGR